MGGICSEGTDIMQFFFQIIRAIITFFNRLFFPSSLPVSPQPPANVPPSVNIISPAADVNAAVVLVEYDISDPNSDPSGVAVKYMIAGGPPQTATAQTQDPRHSGITGLTTTPNGVRHQFVWDWQVNIPQSSIQNVTISVQALDAFGSGVTAISNSIALSPGTAAPPLNNPPKVVIHSPNSNVTANEVVMEYLLSDAESDSADVTVQFCVGGGAPQIATPKLHDPRHSGTSQLQTDPAGVTHRFVWDWRLDIIQNQVNDVVVMTQARDAFSSGPQASSAPFALSVLAGTPPPRNVEITSPVGGLMHPPVLIDYILTDSASTNFSIVVKYSLDNGQTYKPATAHANSEATTGVRSNPQGLPHSFMWDTIVDLSNPNVQDVIIMIQASVGAITLTDVSDRFDIEVNYPPIVDIWSPAGGLTTSPVNIEYVLTDREANPIDIIAEYKLPGGNFQPATRDPGGEGINALTSDPMGVSHHFLWNAATDLSGPLTRDVVFQIRGSDGVGEGSDLTPQFDVGSPLPNVIVRFPVGGFHGSPVAVLYQVSDPTNNTLQAVIKYSEDQGASFNPATVAQGAGSDDLNSLAASPGGVDHFFAWNAVADLTNIPKNDLIIKITVTSPMGSVETNSLPFHITNRIPGAPPLPPISPNPSVPEIRDVFIGGSSHRAQVPVYFTLMDNEMKPTSVIAEYADASGVFKPATPSALSDNLVGMASPDILFNYRFVWDAKADKGLMTNEETITLKMTPYVASIKGAFITKSFQLKVVDKPPLPPVETIHPMTNLQLTIEEGNNQVGVGGFLMPKKLKLKLEGPNPQGIVSPLGGIKLSFCLISPSGIKVAFEEKAGYGATTNASGIAAVCVRTPEVTSTQQLRILASVVGVPQISQTFNLTVGIPEIVQHTSNPTDLTIGRTGLFLFFLDADNDTGTLDHMSVDKDDPLYFRIQATNAVIDNPFPKSPEWDHNLHGLHQSHLAGVRVLPTTPGSNVEITVDIPSKPSIPAQTFPITVLFPHNARKRISYNTSSTSIYQNIFLRFELEQGHNANGTPQRGYPGITLKDPFKVKIKDQNNQEYRFRSSSAAGHFCNRPPVPELLEVTWRGTNLNFSLTPNGPKAGSLTAQIDEAIYITPAGYGPWSVSLICQPGRNRFLDPHPGIWRGTTSSGDPWCYAAFALLGATSGSIGIRGSFLIERANMELFDVATSQVVNEIKPGMRVKIRLNDLSYVGTPDPEPVEVKLEQTDGGQPVAQQGVNGSWTEHYDLFRHSPNEFRSETIWLAQGSSLVPTGINDKIHAIIPLASLVARANSLNFSIPTIGRKRSGLLTENTEMMQEAPV